MAKAPRLPQISKDQLDLWLANTVTKTYLEALSWKAADAQDALGTGAILDSSNSDLSHAMSHGALGKQDAYRDAAQPIELLEFYEMVFYPEDKELNESE